MQDKHFPSVNRCSHNRGIKDFSVDSLSFCDIADHFDPLDYPAGIPLCELVPDWFEDLLED